MDLAQMKKILIYGVRLSPIYTLFVLGLAYLAGGFSDRDDPFIAKETVLTALTLYIVIVPSLFIIGFILVGRAGDRERHGLGINEKRLKYGDPFALPNEAMHGYKLATITERSPTLTGLTGDRYQSDDSASCAKFPEHVPPVASCECGFHAYRDLRDAKMELSLRPGSFLLDVDLYGIGFLYQRGFRAETQVVNKVIAPKRCMRCRIFAPMGFVIVYRLGYYNYSWMQWEMRCNLCSLTFKPEDKLSISQMEDKLQTKIEMNG